MLEVKTLKDRVKELAKIYDDEELSDVEAQSITEKVLISDATKYEILFWLEQRKLNKDLEV